MRRRLFMTAVLAILLGAGFAYLFRTETWNHAELGIIKYHYRWGYAVEESADTNRDGKTDSRALLDTRFARFGERQLPVLELWEDRNFDSRFEIHAYLNDETVIRIEIDEDGDSKPEEIFIGEEAANFFLRFVPKEKDR